MRGKTNEEIFGTDLASRIRSKQSEKAMGRPSKLKGRKYEEIYGERKAIELRSKKFRNVDRHRNKGKTYEEMYGIEKGKELRKLRSRQRIDLNRIIRKKARKSREGSSNRKGIWGECKKVVVCDKCGREINTRGYPNHVKKHSRGREPHKCLNPNCSNAVEWGNGCCSRRCSSIVRCMNLGKEKMSEMKRRSMIEHPETCLAKLTGGMGRSKTHISFPQRRLFEVVSKIIGGVELNYSVNTGKTVRYLDVAVIGKKIDFEYDGEQFHKDRVESDKKRTEELNFLGWKVFRITKKDNFEEKVLSVLREVM